MAEMSYGESIRHIAYLDTHRAFAGTARREERDIALVIAWTMRDTDTAYLLAAANAPADRGSIGALRYRAAAILALSAIADRAEGREASGHEIG